MSGLGTSPASGGDRGGRPRIGKYVIIGRIGRGGMGMVYRGYDEALDREVAVKTLTLDGSLDKESRARFEVEARAAAKLQHPNIVTVFELNQDGKLQYIAMELLPGGDLETLLRSGETLLLPEKLDIVIQVCRGLQYAHERGVVHRDIKPSNIRLLDDGGVKIMDFGIAKLANTHLTKSGMMVGTVHYMCPEQIQGHSVDGRSDVFSVGVILFELLAGRRPFEGQPGNATEVLYKIIQEPMPALPDMGRHTEALQKIVGRALAKKPDERYANAARLADDLAELRSRLEERAAPVSVMETIQAARQMVREGMVDEGVTRLRAVVESTPQSVEARRALRAACREAALRTSTKPEAEADFPELTYQVGATHLQATAYMAPPEGTPAPGPVTAAAAEGRTLLLAGSVVLGFALVAGVVVMIAMPGKDKDKDAGKAAANVGGPRVETPGKNVGAMTLPVKETSTQPPAERTASPIPVGPSLIKVRVASEPPGAGVSLDGKSLAVVTPLEVEIDPTRKHVLSFALDGYATRQLTLPAGATAPDVSVTLAVAGPPGNLAVTAAYPVDVTVGESVVSRGQVVHAVSLPAGRHTVRVTAPALLLRMTSTVDVRSGETVSLVVPAAGQLNVQASPDNCEVFVDGESVGFLPIRKKPLASGRHTVVFKWPDGARDEKTVEVQPGTPAFVTGEKN